jgi:ectoine hydroxylase-related dioxygenase (phytanoyl-CoA dioxygenase family)
MDFQKLTRPGIFSYAAQRMILKNPLRNGIASMIASRRPAANANTDPRTESAVKDLHENGIYMLPKYLSAAAVKEVRAAVDGMPLDERFSPYRKNLDLESIPADAHVAEYRTEALLKSETVMNIANDPHLIAVASQYLGCKPTISNMSIWWSFPTGGKAQEAENYHRDVDDWRFVKFFLYLTDVDSGSGPHRFIRKSQKSNALTNLKRLTDEEVAANFPAEDHLEITADAGDAFMENTFGIHKGQPPINKRRLLLQVEYSINPVAVYNYDAADIGAHGYDPYVNRLYVR